MSIDNFVTAAEGSVCLRLIDIIASLMIRLFSKLPTRQAIASTASHRNLRKMIVHIIMHFIHHFMSVIKNAVEVAKACLHQATALEERVISKRISATTC